MTRIKNSLIGLLTVLSFFTFGQIPDPLKIAELESSVYNDMKVSGAPGAVIAIVKEGQIVYQKAFGLSNVNTEVPVNNSTIFQMASITKAPLTV